MKNLILTILIIVPCVVKSQLAGICFVSKSNEKICFSDSNKVFVRLYYRHLITPHLGQGTYNVQNNHLTIKLQDFDNKDSSCYSILNKSTSTKTSICINCQFIDRSSCEGVEWGIKNDNEFLMFGEIDKTNKTLIQNVDTLKGANTIYIGGLGLNNVEIPIKYGMQTEYMVTLSKKIIYLEVGELSIKLLNKKEQLILKLMNAKKHIGLRTMSFYPEN